MARAGTAAMLVMLVMALAATSAAGQNTCGANSQCQRPLCAVIRCIAGTSCKEFCNNCTATCVPDPSTLPSGPSGPGTCPPGVRTANCLVAPCSLKGACGKDETCTDNYCGGCNAICTKKEDPKLCPNGKPPAKCDYDPCIAATCVTGTRCEANRCGASGCEAKCIPIPPKTCPNGKPAADCSGTSPCAAVLCAFGTRCEADACTKSGKCEGKCVRLCPGGSVWKSSPLGSGCQKCPAGTYSPWNDNSNRCIKCQRGTYSATGSTACKPCPKDTYARRDGSATCTPCPAYLTTKGKRGQSACSPRKHRHSS